MALLRCGVDAVVEKVLDEPTQGLKAHEWAVEQGVVPLL